MILTITFLDDKSLQEEDAWLTQQTSNSPALSPVIDSKIIKLTSEVIKIQALDKQYNLLNGSDSILLEDGMQLKTPNHKLKIELQQNALSLDNKDENDEVSLEDNISLLPGIDSHISLSSLFNTQQKNNYEYLSSFVEHTSSILAMAENNLEFLEEGFASLISHNADLNAVTEVKNTNDSTYDKYKPNK